MTVVYTIDISNNQLTKQLVSQRIFHISPMFFASFELIYKTFLETYQHLQFVFVINITVAHHILGQVVQGQHSKYVQP